MSKISKFGKSLGIIIPPETLSAANLSLGDEVAIVPLQDGVFISATSSVQGRMLAAALEDMSNRPSLYRTLSG